MSKDKKISESIIDNHWFFLSWEKDPTIKSMLTMLDVIQEHFQDKNEVWSKLKNISFHFIQLQNFGLSDDLYIKMNARGKQLTGFENFKAKFEQHIEHEKWENGKEKTDMFSHKMDTLWIDWFWNYSNKEKENIFEECFMNFFSTIATNNYAVKTDRKNNDFEDKIKSLMDKKRLISFNQYLNLECFDKDFFESMKSILNKISEKNELKRFLNNTNYVDEEELFEKVIGKEDLGYADRVIVFAYYQYLALENDINIEHMEGWMRIVRNLVEGSRPYQFYNAEQFARALNSIKELLKHRNGIVVHFAENQDNNLPGFTQQQVKEEKVKAKLIQQNNEWKNAIIEIENHKYFNGQIGFLLDWCKIEDQYNMDRFKEYVEKSKAIFGNEGLNKFDDFLFERALLATGFYLLNKGRYLSFLIDKDRDISWKRLLRDDNEKRNIFKVLIDKIYAESLIKDLKKIIYDFSDNNDWRYYFIKQPEMIANCGHSKLICYINEHTILLLGKKQTNAYHSEYRSYSLFIELKDKLKDELNIKYERQRSINARKYFEYGEKQIAYDNGKYVWTTNDEWENKKEFENREAILKLLT